MEMKDKVILFIVVVLAATATCVQSYVVTYDEGEGGELLPQPQELLGRNPCTYGPSYWCHNITQASECSAVKHCIKSTWSTVRLPPDNDDVCKICKEMVKEARDQLLSNETQSELQQVLEGSCALIPLSLIAKECKKLMDEFMPELVDALASRMDPQLVCSVSGLCNSKRIDDLLQERELTCESCSYYMAKAFNYLNNDTAHLKTLLMEGCGSLGSYSDSCMVAVREEADGIASFMANSNSIEFCQLVGICGEGASAAPTSATAVGMYKPSEDLPCDFCKQLVTSLKSWLTLNTTKEEFDTMVKNLCKSAGKYAKDCTDFFNEYGTEIWQLIVDDLDPESFCQRIGVCPGAKITSGLLWTLLPARSNFTEIIRGEPITSDEQGERKTPKCALCTYVMTQFQNYLDSPETEKTVEKFVSDLCTKYLPKEMSSQCLEFVTEYGDEIIELIGSEVDPSEVCPRLKLCPAKPTAVVVVKDVLPTCALCEFTVTKLINLIGKNHTKESIESATNRVCHMLPKRYTDKCTDFMENYGDQVIEMILIEGSSHEICAALHLCLFSGSNGGGGRVVVDELLQPGPVMMGEGVDDEVGTSNGDDPKCVICEYVISTLAERMKDNATEAEIKQELDQICTHLPKTVTKKCVDFVNMYGDLVIQYLVQEMDPEQVCTELKLCHPKETSNELRVSPCQLCHIIRDYFDMKISNDDNFARNAVESGITRLCGNLRNLKNQCTDMMEDYGEYLVRLLVENKGGNGPGNGGDACEVVAVC